MSALKLQNMKNLLLISFLIISCMKIPDAAKEISEIRDIDGNIYASVSIGTQEWLVENLKVTHYTDGTAINRIITDQEWIVTESPAYCWYDNNESNITNYGALYNFYAVNTNKLCLTGWHVPSDNEWKELELFIGMSKQDVDQQYWRGEGISTLLKSQEGWWAEGGIQNQYGFKGMPAGYRDGYRGDFWGIGVDYNGDGYSDQGTTAWWTSTKYDEANTWTREFCDETTIGRFTATYKGGFSVRCIKNSK
jgi:uncharacterized protein (TIGR02145 family)